MSEPRQYDMEDVEDELWAQAARAVEALKAYLFVEQTNAGRNPHKPGTNRHRAFELGHAVLADPSTAATAEWLRKRDMEKWQEGWMAEFFKPNHDGTNPYAKEGD